MSELNRDHERWREELSGYVLGSLAPAEAVECERHIGECELCQAEVRWLRPAVDRLPQSAPRVEPPPRLRERLLSEAREDARAAASARSPRSMHGRWLRRPSGLRPLAGLAAILLICAAIAGYVIGNSGSGEPEASTIVAGHAPGVTATVIRQGGAATLKLTNVHGLPSQRVLEAWVRRNGAVQPVHALFVPNRDGRAQTTIDNMRGVETVMVTAEPAGGSESPTSAPIVTVPIE